MVVYLSAPVNGIVMTVLQIHFHLTFPEIEDDENHTVLVFQAIFRFINLFFFLVNTYHGVPGVLCRKGTVEGVSEKVEIAVEIYAAAESVAGMA